MQVVKKDIVWFLICIVAAIVFFTVGWKTANWKRDMENDQQVTGGVLKLMGGIVENPQDLLKSIQDKK